MDKKWVESARSEIEKLQECNTGFQTALDDAFDELKRYGAEIERLRSAVRDAIDEVYYWGGQTDAYFQQKHDLEGTLQRLRDALREE